MPSACLPQTSPQQDVSQQVRQLSDALARAQDRIQESQRELEAMRHQLDALQARLAATQPGAAIPPAPVSPPPPSSEETSSNAAEIQSIRETQAVQQSEIATHDQIKVESESKYPVKITGLLLFNTFVNTSGVDEPATPTLAIPGSGSTGATVQQSIIGLDGRGPHLFGAHSYGDLRVDFDGSQEYSSSTSLYSGYTVGLVRLRTAHAGLQWDHTEAYFSLDRPLFSPDSPASLAAVAEPALAWSGNLWTWNPQFGVNHDLALGYSHALRLQAALIYVADAPLTPNFSSSLLTTPPSTTERSRWPGIEARAALLGNPGDANGNHFGVGGYFSEHLTSFGRRFDSWAATADTRLHLPARFQLTASAYRGVGLGGLGGGAFKDFSYVTDPDTGAYYIRPLQDVGGWAELKELFNERVEMNAAFGIDNAFAGDLRRYATPGGVGYLNLARNRTYTGNVIYSPSASLLFSLEYRHLDSSPVLGLSSSTNIVDLAAGYKF